MIKFLEQNYNYSFEDKQLNYEISIKKIIKFENKFISTGCCRVDVPNRENSLYVLGVKLTNKNLIAFDSR